MFFGSLEEKILHELSKNFVNEFQQQIFNHNDGWNEYIFCNFSDSVQKYKINLYPLNYKWKNCEYSHAIVMTKSAISIIHIHITSRIFWETYLFWSLSFILALVILLTSADSVKVRICRTARGTCKTWRGTIPNEFTHP